MVFPNNQSKSYRPLQQIFKTIPSPIYGNTSSPINFTCISRPSEKYKTTNMTYGSFHYDNWSFVQKNRSINYDRKHYMKTNQQKKTSIENQLTSNICCPKSNVPHYCT